MENSGTSEQPSISSFRVSKAGKARFAPVLGERKIQKYLATIVPSQSATGSDFVSFDQQNALGEASHSFVDETSSVLASLTSNKALLDSIQSQLKRKAIQPEKLLEEPIPEECHSTKRTMEYFLRDRAEGQAMTNSSANFEVAKRVRHGGRTKAKESSSDKIKTATSIVAPQVRLVDGKVVLDEQAHLLTNNTQDLSTETLQVVHESATLRHYTSTTYSRYSGSNRWSPTDITLFYEALSMCGTDFEIISTLFPGRTRQQIKGRYRIEERRDPAAVSRALSNPKPFDPTFGGKCGTSNNGNNNDGNNK